MSAIVNRVTTLAPKLALPVARYGQSKLSRFWYFARVELRPPMPNEFGQIQQGFQKIVQSATTGAWRQLTVKQFALNTLVGLEVMFWFYMGECIGRGSIIGYRPGRSEGIPAPYKYFICAISINMNETFMVRTTPDDKDGLSTDNVQLQLKTTLNDDPNCTNQQQRQKTPSLESMILPKAEHDIMFPNVIDLNVGGLHYTTSLSTLRKYEDSMLAVMFSGRYNLVRDKTERIFIDRDGRSFGHILNYIRSNQMPSESIALDVLHEAEFFCISSLITKLENSSPCVISLRRRESFRRLIPDYEHMKVDIINKSTENRSSFQESRVVITQLDHTKLKGTIPCYNCSREFVTVNHACAFDGLTADLQIQQQLKPIQSDISIDMDKLISFVVDELVHDGFKATAERVTCRFSVRCQSCTLSGLFTAGGILAPRECQNIAHIIKFVWS
ncbi:unnamed protein product [Rotaria magnacalcarata]|uniref:BTB domain-containing protein n=1 Tax=Rotaria magnacalcarata TaxID=392030 RepID=A0A815YQS5_9BILA|nr:unnamed protein product [Rotaria magnacalcarata]CAF1572740.1 unnamed protein product [Rotaria magnacalcarata]CAF2112971.1 unnamed protein product [Rotaria magnacalcarata]CAF2147860.1 unnamed protein product [Rotaria magnacalcarata]CAF2261078.1 unnamed protein product [Rotaria magnacalcarata]